MTECQMGRFERLSLGIDDGLPDGTAVEGLSDGAGEILSLVNSEGVTSQIYAYYQMDVLKGCH